VAESAGACITRASPKLSALVIFVGFNLTFFPQFILGYLGMPRPLITRIRRIFRCLNVLSSAGASILGVGYLIPMLYLMWSLRYGRPAAPIHGAPLVSSGRLRHRRQRRTSPRRLK